LAAASSFWREQKKCSLRSSWSEEIPCGCLLSLSDALIAMSLQILHKTATLASVRVAGSVTRLCKHSFGSSSRGRDGAIDFLYILYSVHIQQLSFSTAAAPSMIQNTTVCNVTRGSLPQTCPRLEIFFIDWLSHHAANSHH
jgi:hypothetical protein